MQYTYNSKLQFEDCPISILFVTELEALVIDGDEEIGVISFQILLQLTLIISRPTCSMRESWFSHPS
jgi:hypothetical protein